MSAADFPVRQEEDVVPARVLVRVGIASVALGTVGVCASSLLLVAVVGTLRPNLAGPSGPRTVGRDLSGVEQTPIWDTRVGEDLRDAQRRELERWGWVDRRAGIAKIPIERAMDLVVDEGAARSKRADPNEDAGAARSKRADPNEDEGAARSKRADPNEDAGAAR
jgi:hypothetical protein